jgi:hypothetical protein
MYQITIQCVHVNQDIQEMLSLAASNWDVKVMTNAVMTKLAETENVSIHALYKILAIYQPSAMVKIIDQIASALMEWKEIRWLNVNVPNVMPIMIVLMTELVLISDA